MTFIRTVLGDIAPDALGFCYAHEHVLMDPCFATHVKPDYLHDSIELAVEELREFHANGGRAMIDATPCGNGRNVLKLAEVSRQSSVHIVCSTGLHLQKHYEPGHWSERYSREDLADLFYADIAKGIDAADYTGPIVRRVFEKAEVIRPTGDGIRSVMNVALTHRAGVIKVASDFDGLTKHEEKVFRAASDAHHLTGCPILTHSEQGTAVLDQIALFRSEGVDLSRVIICHTDRKPDVAYHREILASGVKLEFDSAFRWRGGNPTFDLVLALHRDFPSQIMLGMDAARRSNWKSHGGEPGMSYLIQKFIPALRKCGMTESEIDRLFVKNPAEAFSFAVQDRVPRMSAVR